MHEVVTAILGGGRGTRLSPLTRDRAKPAVPFGGKFRLIDIPISNSLHAGIGQIYVITQYASASLHQHITRTYRFDHFRRGSVDILAAEQNVASRDWYQGTADAVRQNLVHLTERRPRDVLVLSGDQLYLMHVRGFVYQHRRTDADFTVAVKPVPRADARELGILRVNDEGRIIDFVEKPEDDAILDELALDEATLAKLGFDAPPGSLLASMGIYVFKSDVLKDLLDGDSVDFGKEVIPQSIGEYKAYAFPHTGYWEDIGTIPSFHQASIALTRPLPPLNLYSRSRPVFTHPRFLPGTKLNKCDVRQAILCEGSIISDSKIAQSIIGIRQIVREGTSVERSVVMGARFYEDVTPEGQIPLGIGRNCKIEHAILDLDCRIGDDVELTNREKVQEADAANWCIRGGIIVVPREGVIEPGTVV